MYSLLRQFGTEDPRLGDLVQPFENGVAWEVALLGFPHDDGVQRNGGRIGARKGPGAMRALMPRIGTLGNAEYDVDISQLRVADARDVNSSLGLEAAHDMLTKNVEDLVRSGVIPFVVGGGNDQSYPNARGLLQGLYKSEKTPKSFTVVNIDAHLDVRPLTASGEAHSGSPFRQLCEDGLFLNVGGQLIEFAAQGHQCSQAHWNYVLKQPGGEIFSLKQLRRQSATIAEAFQEILTNAGDVVFVSFDLDAICSADCPGVSAPATVGLTAQEALDICYVAGKSPKVKLVDVSEFNPDVESHRTGRLLCLMFYYFLMGYAQRKADNA